jgi:hypothetical protein
MLQKNGYQLVGSNTFIRNKDQVLLEFQRNRLQFLRLYESEFKMSLYWNTKSYGGKEYIVMQHPLRDICTKMCGIKFHYGYGVVQKESKAYKMLKAMPFLRNAQEFPLTILKTLKFVTRSKDIEMVFGRDIYISFQRAMIAYNQKQEDQKFEETQAERNSNGSSKCKFLLLHNDFCSNEKVSGSTGYCRMHILEDKALINEIGIETPSYVGREGFGKETAKFLAQVCKKIEKHAKDKSREELKNVLDDKKEEETVVQAAVTEEVTNG